MFWSSWALFNITLATIMGIYHQGGIIPAQLAMTSLITSSLNTTHSKAHNIEVFWWKTYPPPNFLLGTAPFHPSTNRPLNISTVPLMGFPQSELVFMLMQHMPTCDPSLIERLLLHKEKTDVFVVAPLSAWRLDSTSPGAEPYTYPPTSNFSFAIDFNMPPARLSMTNLAVFRRHVNLDDMDFGDDGVWNTLERVVGRRGLGVWKVGRLCGPVLVDIPATTDEVKENEDEIQEVATLPELESESSFKLSTLSALISTSTPISTWSSVFTTDEESTSSSSTMGVTIETQDAEPT